MKLIILDDRHARVLKCMNGSKTGMTIIDASPREMFSDKQSEHTTPNWILVDRTGNILIGEQDKISI